MKGLVLVGGDWTRNRPKSFTVGTIVRKESHPIRCRLLRRSVESEGISVFSDRLVMTLMHQVNITAITVAWNL